MQQTRSQTKARAGQVSEEVQPVCIGQKKSNEAIKILQLSQMEISNFA